MKKIKKIAASLMAVAAMTTSMVGINASAAMTAQVVSKDIYPGTGHAVASVTFLPGQSYTTRTVAVSSNIIYVSVQFEASTSFSTVSSPVFTGVSSVSATVTSGDVGGTIIDFKSTNTAATSGATASVYFDL